MIAYDDLPCCGLLLCHESKGLHLTSGPSPTNLLERSLAQPYWPIYYHGYSSYVPVLLPKHLVSPQVQFLVRLVESLTFFCLKVQQVTVSHY